MCTASTSQGVPWIMALEVEPNSVRGAVVAVAADHDEIRALLGVGMECVGGGAIEYAHFG